MGLTRKVMRFGIQIPAIIEIYKRIKENQKSPVKMFLTQTLADIFGMLFNFGDHPMYLIRTGFMKSWSAQFAWNWAWWTELMWLIQVILEILVHFVAIKDFQIVIQNLK